MTSTWARSRALQGNIYCTQPVGGLCDQASEHRRECCWGRSMSTWLLRSSGSWISHNLEFKDDLLHSSRHFARSSKATWRRNLVRQPPSQRNDQTELLLL
jgi:hypothetical protein